MMMLVLGVVLIGVAAVLDSFFRLRMEHIGEKWALLVDFERGINFSINQIRGALADDADKPRYIETLPRRGYRFIAEVKHEASAKGVPSVHAPVGANDPLAARGNGGNASSALESFVPALPRVTVKTGRRRWRLVLAGMTAAIAFLAFAGLATYRAVFRSPRTSFENLQISKLTDEGKAVHVAISPDGRYVAYAVRNGTESGLRVRHVETRSDVQIPLPDRDRERFLGLTFSPDGNYLYYVQSNKEIASYNYLYKAPVLGGPALLLGKYADTPVSFSPNGQEFASHERTDFYRRFTGGLARRACSQGHSRRTVR
jgi:WD40 repeat protein